MQICSLAVQVPRREDKGWHGLGLQEDAVQEMQQNYTREGCMFPKPTGGTNTPQNARQAGHVGVV